jgi:hypothetical protein
MGLRITLALTLFFLADADLPRVQDVRARMNRVAPFFGGEEIPLFPPTASASEENHGQTPSSDKAQGGGPNAPQGAAKNATLSEESKLSLIRYVSGEFAKAVKPLPAGKEGFLLIIDKPLNQEVLDRAVATHGAAVNTGDKVQITGLTFRAHSIVVDVNGGGKGKHHWRDHIQIGLGGTMPTMQTTTQQSGGPPGMQPGMGSTIFLEFNKTVPDLSPEDLKKAIQDRRPTVGMDREEVVAAIGKPDHKVRERDSDGNDIEDWIYGQPPSKTVFVRFSGDHVTSIKQFPQ